MRPVGTAKFLQLRSACAKSTAGGKFRSVGYVKFVDLVVDLVGREAGRDHVVAQFISLIRVDRHLGDSIDVDLYGRAISYQTIVVHNPL